MNSNTSLRFYQSITTKLVLLLLVFGLLPLGAVILIVWDTGKELEQKVGKKFETVAVNIADKIDRNLFERYGDVQAFGLNSGVLRRMYWYDRSPDNIVQLTMNKLVQQYGIYALTMMVDLEGKVIAVNNQDRNGQQINTQFLYKKTFSEASWFHDLQAQAFTTTQPFAAPGNRRLTGTVVEDVHIDHDVKKAYPDSDGLALGFSAPIYEDGQVVAYWRNLANFSLVENIVVQAYQELKSSNFAQAEITLLDGKGLLLIDYDPTRDKTENIQHNLESALLQFNLAEENVKIAQEAVAGGTGYLEAVHARKQIWQMGGFTHLKGSQGFAGMNWAVLVRVPSSEATAERDAILNQVWLAALLVLAILIPLGIFVGRRATGRIKEVEQVAEEMAKGNFSSRISKVVNDELGNVGKALNGLGEKSEEVVAQAHAIGEGNFSLEVHSRGQQDILSQALQMMITSLREVGNMAQLVSEGNFSQRITPKGEQDLLGRSMNTMVEHFQELAVQVDTVAEGNYSVEITPRSEEDVLGQAFARMVEQIRERDLQLQMSEAKSQAVVNTAVDGIISIDAVGTVQTYNLAAQKLFGFEANEVIGQNIKMLMPNPYHQEHDGYLSRFRETRISKIIGVGREVIGKRKDGTTFPLYLSLGEMFIGDVQYFTGIIRDLSEENRLKDDLQKRHQEMEQESWLKTAISTINEISQGESNIQRLCHHVIAALAKLLESGCGVVYVKEFSEKDEQDTKISTYQLMGSYAYQARKHISTHIELGEGLVGQCAFEKDSILLTNVPVDYVPIQSGLGEQTPKQVLVTPILFEDEVIGVIELATFQEFSDLQRELLEKVASNFGISLNSLFARKQTESLLSQSQALTLELKAQEEELRTTNEELTTKAQALQRSEEELKQQSEELQVSNEELQAKSESLEVQNAEIERKNRAIELAQRDLQKKAEDLAQASKYKSEFLANMSHELRTPLNSLLILAKTLTDNEEGNLTDDQIESARVIHSGGKDLLHLINDILDLSKVEAGHLSVNVQSVILDDVCGRLHSLAAPLATEKGNTWAIDRAPGLPSRLITDQQRLEQIIKNLLSNAFKFTKQGSVTLRIDQMDEGTTLHQSHLQTGSTIVFSVVDTGLGIPEEKQAAIFEAFQQADGSTSRTYGGTGLGLTISRELAVMLGGEIQLVSEAGKGSTFSLYLPYEYSQDSSETLSALGSSLEESNVNSESGSSPSASDVREGQGELMGHLVSSTAGDSNRLLIIEDDPVFGKILQQYGTKEGYDCSWAKTGQEGLEMASTIGPSVILMDMTLPDLSGDEILEALKKNPVTRHIPVHVISGRDALGATLTKGAVGYLTKPVEGEVLRETLQNIAQSKGKALLTVLLVEDDPIMQGATRQMIEQQGIAEVAVVGTAQGARDYLRRSPCDLLITDLRLPDQSGLELLRGLTSQEDQALPSVIVYTGKDLSREEHQELQEYAACVVMKGGLAPERLLEEMGGLFESIQRVENPSKPSSDGFTSVEDEPLTDTSFLQGQTVLVVDDDIRNVFALSKVLKQSGASVLIADTGALALERLETAPTIDLILLDIMMPKMDGYETTQRIRQQTRFADTPIVILSAKTMPDEEARCLEVGANAYLSKPLDLQQLHVVMARYLEQPAERVL